MKNKGFSLVELIVVIAIMAILVGVAVPVYTNYIDKADKAKDTALLDEINQAFAVVCAGEALDINTVTEATIAVDENGAINLAGMTVKVGTTDITGLGAKMVEILGDDLEFEVIEEIWYNAESHKFVDANMTFTFNGQTITVNAKDVAILSSKNAFSDRGSEALLNDVGVLENLLDTGIGADVLEAVKYSDPFLWALGSYLGMVQGADESDDVYLDKVAAYVVDPENADAIERAQIMFAASQAANVTEDQLNALFGGTGAITSNIEVKNDGVTDYNATMANAALAYGMYTAYIQQYPDAENADNFTLTINSDEFAAYYASEQGKSDLEAYMAAMNMIGDNTDNPEVTTSIMNNGIVDNEDLEQLMKDIMGK